MKRQEELFLHMKQKFWIKNNKQRDKLPCNFLFKVGIGHRASTYFYKEGFL
jgi:hypothetical protein